MNSASLSSGPVTNEAQTGSLAPSERATRHDDTRLRLLDNIWLLTLLNNLARLCARPPLPPPSFPD